MLCKTRSGKLSFNPNSFLLIILLGVSVDAAANALEANATGEKGMISKITEYRNEEDSASEIDLKTGYQLSEAAHSKVSVTSELYSNSENATISLKPKKKRRLKRKGCNCKAGGVVDPFLVRYKSYDPNFGDKIKVPKIPQPKRVRASDYAFADYLNELTHKYGCFDINNPRHDDAEYKPKTLDAKEVPLCIRTASRTLVDEKDHPCIDHEVQFSPEKRRSPFKRKSRSEIFNIEVNFNSDLNTVVQSELSDVEIEEEKEPDEATMKEIALEQEEEDDGGDDDGEEQVDKDQNDTGNNGSKLQTPKNTVDQQRSAQISSADQVMGKKSNSVSREADPLSNNFPNQHPSRRNLSKQTKIVKQSRKNRKLAGGEPKNHTSRYPLSMRTIYVHDFNSFEELDRIKTFMILGDTRHFEGIHKQRCYFKYPHNRSYIQIFYLKKAEFAGSSLLTTPYTEFAAPALDYNCRSDKEVDRESVIYRFSIIKQLAAIFKKILELGLVIEELSIDNVVFLDDYLVRLGRIQRVSRFRHIELNAEGADDKKIHAEKNLEEIFGFSDPIADVTLIRKLDDIIRENSENVIPIAEIPTYINPNVKISFVEAFYSAQRRDEVDRIDNELKKGFLGIAEELLKTIFITSSHPEAKDILSEAYTQCMEPFLAKRPEFVQNLQDGGIEDFMFMYYNITKKILEIVTNADEDLDHPIFSCKFNDSLKSKIKSSETFKDIQGVISVKSFYFEMVHFYSKCLDQALVFDSKNYRFEPSLSTLNLFNTAFAKEKEYKLELLSALNPNKFKEMMKQYDIDNQKTDLQEKNKKQVNGEPGDPNEEDKKDLKENRGNEEDEENQDDGTDDASKNNSKKSAAKQSGRAKDKDDERELEDEAIEAEHEKNKDDNIVARYILGIDQTPIPSLATIMIDERKPMSMGPEQSIN